jgi:dTDP-4-amino-4,6-dideoxy-D-galactose acyltransferase
MINLLKWDSTFFNRKIGELKFTNESFSQIETALEKAKDEAFEYVIYKLQNHHTIHSMHLESLGFYLSDIGIIWAIQVEKIPYIPSIKNNTAIRVAKDSDIPSIKKITKSLFLESRFYNDPFFSKKDADKLYDAWVDNSIKGDAADYVLYSHNKGFITCKKISTKKGNIVLIGVKKDHRGKSLGSTLVKEALKWFQTQGVNLVSVRTQLKNLDAMNFYSKLGFYIKKYDMIYAKIIQS